MLNVIIITAIVTIVIYSTVTFIISNIALNDDVDQMLAWGVVGMTLWFITTPIRKYAGNGFYICEFYKNEMLIDSIFTRGGQKPYQKLLEKYPKDRFECVSKRIKFIAYFKGKYFNK